MMLFVLVSGCSLLGAVDDDYRLRPEVGSGGGAAASTAANGGSDGGNSAGGGGSPSTGGEGGGGAPRQPRRVFVTSSLHDGAFGPDAAAAIAGADSACATLHGDARVAWVTWFTNAARPDMAPVLQGGGPWYLLDDGGRADGKQLVAEDYADLTDGHLVNAIDVDESGTKLAGEQVRVWTGTNPDGTSDGVNCGDWTSEATVEYGRYGLAHAVDETWTTSITQACGSVAQLYCFEIP